MPNYNYYPATYNPYSYAYQPIYNPPVMAQPQPQTINTQQPASQTTGPISTGINWVGNIKEAQMWPVAPNAAVALWDSGAPVVYLKQADATGKPTLKIFDLVERPERPSESVSGAGEKLPDFATKDELAAVVGLVRNFDGTLKDIRAEMDKMSGDMYGIAGKKKATKKVDLEEE